MINFQVWHNEVFVIGVEETPAILYNFLSNKGKCSHWSHEQCSQFFQIFPKQQNISFRIAYFKNNRLLILCENESGLVARVVESGVLGVKFNLLHIMVTHWNFKRKQAMHNAALLSTIRHIQILIMLFLYHRVYLMLAEDRSVIIIKESMVFVSCNNVDFQIMLTFLLTQF